jgi:hypothetical protein
MAAARKNTGKALAEPVSREVLLAQYGALLEQIPLAQDDDGFGLIKDILTATNWQELNRESELDNLQKYVGKTLKIIGMERRVSEIEGGMPWYLMVDAIDVASGELIKLNTSAGTPMAKMTMLHKFNNLPALVKITKTDKATRSGFYPLELEVLGVNDPAERAS